MSRKHLTDTLIRDTLAKMKPGDARVEFADDVPPFVRVRISHGLAAFYWIGRNPTTRKTERHKLGILGPTMSTKLAREAAAKLKGAAHEGKNIVKAKRETKRTADSGRKTVRDLAQAYIAQRIADDKPLSPSTLRHYNQRLPQMLGEYMDRPMDALDDETLLTAVRDNARHRMGKSKHGVPVKRGNVVGTHIAVKCLARLCRVHRLPDVTAFLRVENRMPESKDAKGNRKTTRKGRLGTVEAQKLFAWLDAYARDPQSPPYRVRCARMFQIAIVTGWRIGTVGALQWEHVDFKARTIEVPPNKMGHDQTVPLWPVIADLLKGMHTRGATGMVFDAPYSGTFNDELPWKLSPHDARKTLSVVLSEAKGPAVALDLLMGHINSVTTKHYFNETPVPDQVRALRPVVDQVSAFYAAKLGDKAALRELAPLAAARQAAERARRSNWTKGEWQRRKAKRQRLAA